MKALSKERDRRYETANGFAKDVERFLNHEPVSGRAAECGVHGAEVRPPQSPAGDRGRSGAGRLARRHRGDDCRLDRGGATATARSRSGRSRKSRQARRLRQAEGIRAEPGLRQKGERDPRVGLRRARTRRQVTPPSPRCGTPYATTWQRPSANWTGPPSATRWKWRRCRTHWGCPCWAWGKRTWRSTCSASRSPPTRNAWGPTTPTLSR